MLAIWLLGGTGMLRNVEYHLGHPDHTYTRAREAATADAVDVLFIGSSHAYRTFDPRVFAANGLTTFNLGSSNQTPIQTEALLHRYLHRLNPRLVVFEVHPDILAYDGVESSLYWLCNAPPSIHNIPMVIRSHNAKVVCTAIYATLHNACSKQFGTFAEEPCIDGNCYVRGGFVERNDEPWKPSPQPADTVHPLPDQLHALQRTLQWLAKEGVDCLMLEVPDSRALEEATAGLEEFRQQMRALGDFHCPRPEALCDSLHFLDPGHLNPDGARLYCDYITDLIYEHLGTHVRNLARRAGPGPVRD